jgi:hypothetical protein
VVNRDQVRPCGPRPRKAADLFLLAVGLLLQGPPFFQQM